MAQAVFWKMGAGFAVLGVLLIIGYFTLFKEAENAGLALVFGIVFLVGGLSGGVWAIRRNGQTR